MGIGMSVHGWVRGFRVPSVRGAAPVSHIQRGGGGRFLQKIFKNLLPWARRWEMAGPWHCSGYKTLTFTSMNRLKNSSAFTLVEIMIVVAIIALLAAIATPNFLRARKRSQASVILDDLRALDSAVDQYAIESNKTTGDPYVWSDLMPFLKRGSRMYSVASPSGIPDLVGNPIFSTGQVDVGTPGSATVGLSQASFNALSDVAPLAFWSPFGVAP